MNVIFDPFVAKSEMDDLALLAGRSGHDRPSGCDAVLSRLPSPVRNYPNCPEATVIPFLARQLVEEVPHLPCVVPTRRLLRSVLRTRNSLWLQGIGALLVWGGVRIAGPGWEPDRRAIVFGIASGIPGLCLASAPIVFCRRLVKHLQTAPIGYAEVQDVEIEYRSNRTIDATTNGFARGSWRVLSADGRSFVEKFEVDEPFARQLRGCRIQVLVDSRTDRTVFNLALVDGAGQPSGERVGRDYQ